MYVVFFDESGYAPNWAENVDEQPFYILAAVCVSTEALPALYEEARVVVDGLNLPGQCAPLGRGFEIKARDIARGGGWWTAHDEDRNTVRELMLSLPERHSACAIVVVVDKEAHLRQYVAPEDPHLLALQYALERVQRLLDEQERSAICVYDQNKRLEDELSNHAVRLVRDGSEIMYYSPFYEELVAYTYQMDRIADFCFGHSENSIGLQIADYFATMTYFYYKDGQRSPCGWWDTLCGSLRRVDGVLEGYGLKVFP